MGLTQLEICNQALLKLGADTIDTLTPPVSTEDGTKRSIELCNIFFDQAYDEILRIYQWNSATKRGNITLRSISLPEIDDSEGRTYNPTGEEFNDRPIYKDDSGNWKIDFSGVPNAWTYQNTASPNYNVLKNDSTDGFPPKTGWYVSSVGLADEPLAITLSYDELFGYENFGTKPTDMIRLINCFRSDDQRDQRTAWVLEGDYILANEDKLYIRYIAKPAETTDLEPLCTEALICNLAKKLAPALQLDADWETKLNNELYNVILPKARSIDTFENKELLLEESDWMLSRTYQYPII